MKLAENHKLGDNKANYIINFTSRAMSAGIVLENYLKSDLKFNISPSKLHVMCMADIV